MTVEVAEHGNGLFGEGLCDGEAPCAADGRADAGRLALEDLGHLFIANGFVRLETKLFLREASAQRPASFPADDGESRGLLRF